MALAKYRTKIRIKSVKLQWVYNREFVIESIFYEYKPARVVHFSMETGIKIVN